MQKAGAGFALHEDAERVTGGEGRHVPVAQEVDAVVIAAACAGEGEVEAC